jgi:hypothetical protein
MGRILCSKMSRLNGQSGLAPFAHVVAGPLRTVGTMLTNGALRKSETRCFQRSPFGVVNLDAAGAHCARGGRDRARGRYLGSEVQWNGYGKLSIMQRVFSLADAAHWV